MMKFKKGSKRRLRPMNSNVKRRKLKSEKKDKRGCRRKKSARKLIRNIDSELLPILMKEL